MELGQHDDTTQWCCMALLSCPMPVFYATRWGYFLCKSLGAPLEGVRKNPPPPYSAPFAWSADTWPKRVLKSCTRGTQWKAGLISKKFVRISYEFHGLVNL